MNKLDFLSMGIKPVKVLIKSLNQELYLKELSYKGAATVAQCINPIDRTIHILVHSLCDENGALIFTIDDVETIAEAFTFAQIQEIAVKASELTENSNTVK